MNDRKTIESELLRGIYRTKLALSRFIPNKDNLPFSLLSRRMIETRAEQNRASFKDRKVIFTISPGRAGSEYLATLLNTAGNIYALHEPLPRMNGRYLEQAMSRPLSKSYLERKIKIIGINRVLSRLDEDTIYAETSHMFIKSFHDVVLDYFENAEVIILRRPLYKILKSFIELGFYSNANPASARWLHTPDSRNSLAEIPKPVDKMDQFEKCIAYLLDIEARAQAFSVNHPHIRTHDVSLEAIIKIEGAKQLFKDLGAQWTSTSEGLCSNVVNRKPVYKSAIGKSTSEDYCRERLKRYVQLAKDAGKSIPDIEVI